MMIKFQVKLLFSYILFLSFFCLIACNRAPKVQEVQSEVHDSAQVETIAEDNMVYPTDSGFLFKLIPTGTHHGDEVWEDVEQTRWLGLIRNGRELELKSVLITKEFVFDEILDEEGQKTAVDLKAIGEDSCVLLIEVNELMKASKLKSVQLPRDELKAGESTRFDFNGKRYMLFATGEPDKDNPEICYSYRLWLKNESAGSQSKPLLLVATLLEYKLVPIIAVADFDGDGNPDFLIDASGHYNAFSPVLYLSKPAGGKHVVPVAGHTSTGC
jgi:hypothetical protein